MHRIADDPVVGKRGCQQVPPVGAEVLLSDNLLQFQFLPMLRKVQNRSFQVGMNQGKTAVSGELNPGLASEI